MNYNFKVIARIQSSFPSKFGVPRQSGLVPSLLSRVVFLPEYRNRDAFRGLEDFSHLWLIWCFSEAVRDDWSPTVRPPRLGGNVRMGVFATRSPFRPNPVGLSSVRLERIEWDAPDGPALLISGADLMDGTPIFDVKPYLAFTDSHPDASAGFSGKVATPPLQVQIPPELDALLPQELRLPLRDVLSGDPRPSYQNEPERVYRFEFESFHVSFQVSGQTLTVTGIERLR